MYRIGSNPFLTTYCGRTGWYLGGSHKPHKCGSIPQRRNNMLTYRWMLISSMPVEEGFKRWFESNRQYNKRVSYNGYYSRLPIWRRGFDYLHPLQFGPDADGRSSGLQPHRLGSIPTVSTKTGVINRVLTRDVSYITVRFGTSNF